MRWYAMVLLAMVAVAAQADTVGDKEQRHVRAWQAFTRQLEQVGSEVLRGYPQPEAIDAAEAIPYLLQQLSTAVTRVMIEQPGQPPLLRVDATTINKWSLDGADVKYLIAPIDPQRRYRMTATRGDARLFAMQAVRMAAPYAAFESITSADLDGGAGDSFEVLLSRDRPEDWSGLWLEIHPDTDYLLLREYFAQWDSEKPGRYFLTDLDAVDPEPLSMDRADAMLDSVIAAFDARISQWQPLVERIRENRVNTVSLRNAPGQGLSTNYYGTSWFRVPAGKALLIEWEPPEALLWSVQLANAWWESIDYINHTASYNSEQALIDPDGVYRFVVAHEDPGYANWLDPAGHPEGTLLFRVQLAERAVDPEVTLVDVAELAASMPENARRMSPEARQHLIDRRRAHAAVRWAP